MKNLEELLKGGDLRSIGNSNEVVSLINNQQQFDDLFKLLFNQERKIVMRSADAIEKITLKSPHFLESHKQEILLLAGISKNKELIWHLALLMPRLSLSKNEFEIVWNRLSGWLTDRNQSRIVRVNSLTAMHTLTHQNKTYLPKYDIILGQLKENIPSLNARIRILEKNAPN